MNEESGYFYLITLQSGGKREWEGKGRGEEKEGRILEAWRSGANKQAKQ